MEDLLSILSVKAYYALIFTFGVFFILLVHRALLPRPIPGIPYNKKASKRVLGDLLDLINAPNDREWMVNQGIALNSPIYQIFLGPTSKPTVLISDWSEIVDITMRRFKEFDRSQLNIDGFNTVVSGSQVAMHSDDPRFKRNRELVRDLMSPSFLNNVSAPHIYDGTTRLIELWDRKLSLSNATYGLDVSRTHLVKELASLKPNSQRIEDTTVAKGETAPFTFEHVPASDELRGTVAIAESCSIVIRSPFPAVHHFIYRNIDSTMRKAIIDVKALREREIGTAIKRLEVEAPEWCALDHMLARESAMAKKEGKSPDFYGDHIAKEMLTYLIAGHETTSAVLQWCVKYLTVDQERQAKLRNILRTTFPGRLLPTCAEVAKSRIPYMEAVIEESLRLGQVLTATFRDAMEDTTVMGVGIPKGTTICLVGNGPGLCLPASLVAPYTPSSADSHKRGKEKTGRFSDEDITQFVPERWLKATTGGDGKEKVEFDPNAGPNIPFGLGPRGCFGKKLAYMQLRIVLTLLFWKYKFGDLPQDLGTMDEKISFARYPKYSYAKLEVA